MPRRTEPSLLNGALAARRGLDHDVCHKQELFAQAGSEEDNDDLNSERITCFGT